jgi:FlaA1/EpsC-like NDP-sugar epimerase
MDKLFSREFTYKIAAMKRFYKRSIMVCADLTALPLALLSAFMLRLSEWWPSEYIYASLPLFIIVPIFGIYIFMRLGLYMAVVRFMGAQAIWAVIKGIVILALILWSAATILDLHPFPRSVPVIFALAALVYVGGSRLLIRHVYHWLVKQHSNKDAVLIYGAGGAGIQLATALSDGREFYIRGFVDDESSLWGATIKGFYVHKPSHIAELIRSENIKHILLAVPNATSKQRKEILSNIEGFSVHVQTIPSMPELLSGQALIEQLREVQIEELLGRDPVAPMKSLLTRCIKDRVVMVTGAGGSIGSELCRQIIHQGPKKLILFEISEYNLYQIEREIQQLVTDLKIDVKPVAILASVADSQRVQSTLKSLSVETVYHAAAYKHVPIVEHNMMEGIKNNIFGTKVLAEAAAKAGVKHFILISTDKAVRPTNVMGATKRFAELVLQSMASSNPRTIFSMVRFGNVLGSSGSVVPLFHQQIQRGGPITVTHKEITRYFMTIPEAASLVIQAGSMARGGDVFVLDMGEPVKIIDLAKRMVHLSGLEIRDENNPEGDIVVECTGLRPAEKLYEELLIGSNVIGTEHTKIMKANEEFLSPEELKGILNELKEACENGDCLRGRSLLQHPVVGYKPHDFIVDHLSEANKSTVVKLC